MIARDEMGLERADVWRRLAEPVDDAAIGWRQDGRIIQRDGRYFARFVAYIEANTVRERLDAVVPGEWDLTLELLPPIAIGDEPDAAACSFKARLQILGVIREDVGFGRDYKSASTDAFKRAAVRFGIAHELYAYEQNWVEMDGDGRYAKPVEDPAEAYARRLSRKSAAARPRGRARAVESSVEQERAEVEAEAEGPATVRASGAPSARASGKPSAGKAGVTPLRAEDTPPCPTCGGQMWDNRLTKRNPKAPDFKCRDRNCDGVIWPAHTAEKADAGASRTAARKGRSDAGPLVEQQEAELSA